MSYPSHQNSGSPLRRRFALSIGLYLCVFWLASLVGCGTEPAQGPAAEKIRSATIAYGIDLEGINELVVSPNAFHTLITHFALFIPLAEEQADYQDGPPTFAPKLAESWEHSEDGKAITFHLRRDVRWSDGSPVDAEDVRFTWQAQIDDSVGWAYAEFKKRIQDVEVIDAHTVRFHFPEAYPQQFFDAVQGVILPRRVWGQLPFERWREESGWFAENLVVSGPFELESWQPQQRIVLRRNESYFEPGLPKLDRVVFEIVPDTTTQLSLLRAGQVDFIELVPYAEAEALRARPDIYLTSFIPRNYFFVGWNLTREPFDSVNVRRALTQGIDRQAIIDSQFYGHGSISVGPLASDVWAYHDGLEPWPYDPQEASRLLAEEGFADTDGDGVLDRDGKPFRFELITNADNTLRRDIMVMIQSQLKKIGIEVETRAMEFNSMTEPLNKREYDGVILGLSVGTDLDLSYNFHTSGADGGLNWGAFSHPRVDALLDEIQKKGASQEMKPQFLELQELLHDQQPVTFLYEGVRLSGVRKHLVDVDPNALSAFANLRKWRLEDAGEPAS